MISGITGVNSLGERGAETVCAYTTKTVMNSLNPVWNEVSFLFYHLSTVALCLCSHA